jgi:hypothetical protein
MEELTSFARSCTRRGTFIRVMGIAVLSAPFLAGCLDPGAEAESARPARVTGAEESVRRYLEKALYARVRTDAGGEEICESAATYPLLALAEYQILGSEMHGDTALVEAEVSSVATLTQHPRLADRYIVTQSVRRDTLHFPLLRAGPSPEWRICGYAREFIDFFGPNDVDDSAVEWRPAGASWQTLRTTVDSLVVQ